VDAELKQGGQRGTSAMTKIASFLTLLITALVFLLPAAPAQAAQRDRVFVASYGSDSNPCTFGSPCKTFQQAINVVAVGGEVTAIDSAGFGPLSVTQSVTITSPAGVEAGIQAGASGDAVYINAPGGIVKLRGLTLEGANSALTGIYLNSGSRIEVVDCNVSNFIDHGIYIAPFSATTVSVLISNTIATGNANGGGIYFDSGESGSITAAFDHVTLANNFFGFGAEMFSNSSGSIETLITDSHIDNNTAGISLSGGSASNVNSVILKNVTLNDDADFGIALTSYTSAWLSHVTQTSVPGFVVASINFVQSPTSAFAYSDGSNHLMGSTFGGSTTSWAPN